MQTQVQGEITVGTIYCNDSTVRVIRGFLRNYAEVGKIIEGDNYKSSSIEAKEIELVKRVLPSKRTADECLALKAEKTAFKQRLKLKYPIFAANGLSANQIWKLTCSHSDKTN